MPNASKNFINIVSAVILRLLSAKYETSVMGSDHYRRWDGRDRDARPHTVVLVSKKIKMCVLREDVLVQCRKIKPEEIRVPMNVSSNGIEEDIQIIVQCYHVPEGCFVTYITTCFCNALFAFLSRFVLIIYIRSYRLPQIFCYIAMFIVVTRY